MRFLRAPKAQKEQNEHPLLRASRLSVFFSGLLEVLSWLWMVKDTSEHGHTFFSSQKCLCPPHLLAAPPQTGQVGLTSLMRSVLLKPGQISFIFPMLAAWLSSALLPKPSFASLQAQGHSSVSSLGLCPRLCPPLLPAWQEPKPLLASQQSSDPQQES